jgi:putative ABC transport system ATP-binding protein
MHRRPARRGLSDRRLSGLGAYRLGVVFQHFFLIEQMTALDSGAAGLLYRGVPARERRAAGRRGGRGNPTGYPVTETRS